MAKRIKTIEIYECDCCKKEIGIEMPKHSLTGPITMDGRVLFDPVVLNDYCEDCLDIAQHNWNNEYLDGFVADRLEVRTEEALRRELIAMHEYAEYLKVLNKYI